MSDYDEDDPKRRFRFTATVKLDWESHTQLQDLITHSGMTASDALRMLIDSGLAVAAEKGQLSPRAQVALAKKKVREADELHQELCVLRWKLPTDEFQALCRLNSRDPEDYADVPEPASSNGRLSKTESFLKVLFADRPDGLPGKRVLELAERVGIGRDLVYERAKLLGITYKRAKVGDSHQSVWVAPPGW